MGDTLPAENTLGILDQFIFLDRDSGSFAGSHQGPDTDALDLVADIDAAHALDAVAGIPDQRKILIPEHILFGREVLGIEVLMEIVVIRKSS
jgi:hypothetical protein